MSKVSTYTHRIELPHSPARAFDALTDPVALEKWFAERVRIEARVGGAYAFWGRHTPWVESETLADQRIIALEPGRALGFTWTWRGAPCSIEIALSPPGGVTEVRMTMTCGGDRMGFGDECVWFMSDFCTYTLGNLRSYLKSGVAALRPDFKDKSRGVDLSIVIEASPEKVFRSLTDPVQMNMWLATAASAELRPGGAYSYGWMIPPGHPCGPTRIVEVIPNELIVHDWGYMDEPRTEVRWELTRVPEGTRVRLLHVRRDVEPEIGGYMQGWASFLVLLQEFAVLGKPSRRPGVDPNQMLSV